MYILKNDENEENEINFLLDRGFFPDILLGDAMIFCSEKINFMKCLCDQCNTISEFEVLDNIAYQYLIFKAQLLKLYKPSKIHRITLPVTETEYTPELITEGIHVPYVDIDYLVYEFGVYKFHYQVTSIDDYLYLPIEPYIKFNHTYQRYGDDLNHNIICQIISLINSGNYTLI